VNIFDKVGNSATVNAFKQRLKKTDDEIFFTDMRSAAQASSADFDSGRPMSAHHTAGLSISASLGIFRCGTTNRNCREF